jgi:hypothetical protein
MTWVELTYSDDLAVDVVQFNRVMAGEIDGYSMDKGRAEWIPVAAMLKQKSGLRASRAE